MKPAGSSFSKIRVVEGSSEGLGVAVAWGKAVALGADVDAVLGDVPHPKVTRTARAKTMLAANDVLFFIFFSVSACVI